MSKAATPLRRGWLNDNRDWITCTIAAAELKIHPKAVHRLYTGGHLGVKRADDRFSPVVVEWVRMRETAEACADACTVAEVKRLVGVDDPEGLVSCGLLRKAAAGAEVVYLVPNISRRSVEDLKAAIAGRAVRHGEGMAPLRDVVDRLGFLGLPWAEVLAAAKDGRLPVELRERSSASSIVEGLLAADDDATRRRLLSFRQEVRRVRLPSCPFSRLEHRTEKCAAVFGLIRCGITA